MRVVRKGVIQPGIESVPVPELGAFNFLNGAADFHEEHAKILIKLGICAPRDGDMVKIADSAPDKPEEVGEAAPPGFRA